MEDCAAGNWNALRRGCSYEWASTTNSPLIYAVFGPLIISDQQSSADRRQRKSAVNQDTKSHF